MTNREFNSHTVAQVSKLLRHKERIRQRECDIPNARTCAIILNMFRDEKEREEPYTVLDILPFLDTDAKELTLEEQQLAHAEAMILKTKSMMMRLGGVISLDPNAPVES